MPRNERFHYLRMLGVEVFREKQGQGGKPREAGKEEAEKDAVNKGAGRGDEEEEEEVMDSENVGENGSLEAKAAGESLGASS